MHISLAAEKIGFIHGWPITNTIVTFWLSIAVILVLSVLATRRMQMIPGKLQSAFEWVIESLYGVVKDVFGSDKEAKRYFPFLATFFLGILVSNWMGILPGWGSIGWHHVIDGKQEFVPLLRSTNADLNTTLAYALISVGATQYFGVRQLGVGKYLGKFFNFKSGIGFFLGILELVSEFAKIISFSFRLFGNIFAGEVLLMVIAFLVPVIAPLPFLGLELFVGVVQALVFFMLTSVFIKVATEAAH